MYTLYRFSAAFYSYCRRPKKISVLPPVQPVLLKGERKKFWKTWITWVFDKMLQYTKKVFACKSSFYVFSWLRFFNFAFKKTPNCSFNYFKGSGQTMPPPTTHHQPKYIHHHPPPAKIYPPLPTISQKMDHHPAKAKIYSYITSFRHCFNSFTFFQMQCSFRWRRFFVIKFWSVRFSNSKFLLHPVHFTIFKVSESLCFTSLRLQDFYCLFL